MELPKTNERVKFVLPSVPVDSATNKDQHLQRMVEMKKIYEFWKSIATKRNPDNESYLPFPGEDDWLSKLGDDTNRQPDDNFNEFVAAHANDSIDQSIATSGVPGLNDKEIGYLKSKISEFMSLPWSKSYPGSSPGNRRPREEKEGFSLYGTNDEEGLHDGNAEGYDDDDEDYDLDELEDAGNFSYDYGPHHIEVEVNNGPPGPDGADPNEPSCEFTFEYDRNGTLVSTDNNIEEKLRLMCLQLRDGEETAAQTAKKKKSLKKKKKKAAVSQTEPADDACCLFCQYEAFFGVKPVHMMKWYDKKILREEKRRQKIREKLENAKLKALRRQREFRQGSDVENTGDNGQ